MRSPISTLFPKVISSFFALTLAFGLVPAAAFATEGDAAGNGFQEEYSGDALSSYDGEGQAEGDVTVNEEQNPIIPAATARINEDVFLVGESAELEGAAGAVLAEEPAVSLPVADIVNQMMPLEMVAQSESTRTYFLAQTLESTRTVPVLNANLPLDTSTGSESLEFDEGDESEAEGGEGSDEPALASNVIAMNSTVIGSFESLGMTFAFQADGESVILMAVDYSKLPKEFIEKQIVVIPDAVTPDGIDYYSVARIADDAFASLKSANANVDCTGCAALLSDEELLSEAGIDSNDIGGIGSLVGRTGILALGIPASVTAIEDNAFAGFDALQYIVVLDGNSNFASYDGALYSADLTNLRLIPEGRVGTVCVASSVTEVTPEVFSHCPLVDTLVTDADGNENVLLKKAVAETRINIFSESATNQKSAKPLNPEFFPAVIRAEYDRAIANANSTAVFAEARDAKAAVATKTLNVRVYNNGDVYNDWSKKSADAKNGLDLVVSVNTDNWNGVLNSFYCWPEGEAGFKIRTFDSGYPEGSNLYFGDKKGEDEKAYVTQLNKAVFVLPGSNVPTNAGSLPYWVTKSFSGTIKWWLNGYAASNTGTLISEFYGAGEGGWDRNEAGDIITKGKTVNHAGQLVGSGKVNVTVAEAPTIAPEGQRFLGWRCSNGNTYQPGDVIKDSTNWLFFDAIWGTELNVTVYHNGTVYWSWNTIMSANGTTGAKLSMNHLNTDGKNKLDQFQPRLMGDESYSMWTSQKAAAGVTNSYFGTKKVDDRYVSGLSLNKMVYTANGSNLPTVAGPDHASRNTSFTGDITWWLNGYTYGNTGTAISEFYDPGAGGWSRRSDGAINTQARTVNHADQLVGSGKVDVTVPAAPTEVPEGKVFTGWACSNGNFYWPGDVIKDSTNWLFFEATWGGALDAVVYHNGTVYWTWNRTMKANASQGARLSTNNNLSYAMDCFQARKQTDGTYSIWINNKANSGNTNGFFGIVDSGEKQVSGLRPNKIVFKAGNSNLPVAVGSDYEWPRGPIDFTGGSTWWLNGYTFGNTGTAISEFYNPGAGGWSCYSDGTVSTQAKTVNHADQLVGSGKANVTVADAPTEAPEGKTFIGWKCSNGKVYQPGDVIENSDNWLFFDAQWGDPKNIIVYRNGAVYWNWSGTYRADAKSGLTLSVPNINGWSNQFNQLNYYYSNIVGGYILHNVDKEFPGGSNLSFGSAVAKDDKPILSRPNKAVYLIEGSSLPTCVGSTQYGTKAYTGTIKWWLDGYTYGNTGTAISEFYDPGAGGWGRTDDGTIDTKGKTVNHADQLVGSGKANVTVADAPTEAPEGKTFIGWKCSNGKVYQPGDVIENSDNWLFFDAQWGDPKNIIVYRNGAVYWNWSGTYRADAKSGLTLSVPNINGWSNQFDRFYVVLDTDGNYRIRTVDKNYLSGSNLYFGSGVSSDAPIISHPSKAVYLIEGSNLPTNLGSHSSEKAIDFTGTIKWWLDGYTYGNTGTAISEFYDAGEGGWARNEAGDIIKKGKTVNHAGQLVGSGQVNVTVADAPTEVPEGKTFVGWRCSNGNTYQPGDVIENSDNWLFFTAIWRGSVDVVVYHNGMVYWQWNSLMQASGKQGVRLSTCYEAVNSFTMDRFQARQQSDSTYSVFINDKKNSANTNGYFGISAIDGKTPAGLRLNKMVFKAGDSNLPIAVGSDYAMPNGLLDSSGGSTWWIDGYTHGNTGTAISEFYDPGAGGWSRYGDNTINTQARTVNHADQLVGSGKVNVTVAGAPTEAPDSKIFVGWRCSNGNTYQPGDVITNSDNWLFFDAAWADRYDVAVNFAGGFSDDWHEATFGTAYERPIIELPTNSGNIKKPGHVFQHFVAYTTADCTGDPVPVLEVLANGQTKSVNELVPGKTYQVLSLQGEGSSEYDIAVIKAVWDERIAIDVPVSVSLGVMADTTSNSLRFRHNEDHYTNATDNVYAPLEFTSYTTVPVGIVAVTDDATGAGGAARTNLAKSVFGTTGYTKVKLAVSATERLEHKIPFAGSTAPVAQGSYLSGLKIEKAKDDQPTKTTFYLGMDFDDLKATDLALQQSGDIAKLYYTVALLEDNDAIISDSSILNALDSSDKVILW